MRPSAAASFAQAILDELVRRELINDLSVEDFENLAGLACRLALAIARSWSAPADCSMSTDLSWRLAGAGRSTALRRQDADAGGSGRQAAGRGGSGHDPSDRKAGGLPSCANWASSP